MRIQLTIIAFLLTLSACGSGPDHLRIHITLKSEHHLQQISSVLEQNANISLDKTDIANKLQPLESLRNNNVDLLVVENSASFVSGVRAILPVFNGVLHLLVKDELYREQRRQFLKNKTIYVANPSAIAEQFIQFAAKRAQVTRDEYQIVDRFIPGTTDILIYFGPIRANDPDWIPPGYRLASISDGTDQSGGTSVDLIRYAFPKMKPYVIPAQTYKNAGNEQPIVTVAVDMILVTRKAVPAQVIYKLTETLIEQKPRFTAVMPEVFSGISDSFDPLELNFPLHKGARRYFERDEPSFLERYAEMINMITYAFFMLVTGFLGFVRWNRRRKKNRTDTFYQRVLDIREQIRSNTGYSAEELAQKLNAIEKEAFQLLIDEKLTADESFQIFITLLHDTFKEFERIKKID